MCTYNYDGICNLTGKDCVSLVGCENAIIEGGR